MVAKKKTQRPLVQSERDLHLQVVALLRAAAAPGVVWYHNANERQTSPRQGAFLKRMGVLAGVPDFTILMPGKQAHFLELKRVGGKLTAAQQDFVDLVQQGGCVCAKAHTLDEAQTYLVWWGAIRAAKGAA